MKQRRIVIFLLWLLAIALLVILPLHHYLLKKSTVLVVTKPVLKKKIGSAMRVTPVPSGDTKEPPGPKTVALKEILGFYTTYNTEDKKSYHSLEQFSSYMNSISTLTFSLSADGTLEGAVPADGVKLSNAKHIKPLVAISNSVDGNFDKNLAHTLLNDPSVRQKAIDNIYNLIQNNGYQGVDIDFENMLSEDRTAFTQFIKQLETKLHPSGDEVIVSVTAKEADAPKSPWAGAFDYKALGDVADQIQIMTYDENGPWAEPGPVASIAWVKKTLDYAVSQIPSSKILIGLPAYGYDWNTSTGKGNKAVTWKNINQLLTTTGATPKWDAQAESPYFQYTAKDGSKHIVWYENQTSIADKTELVNQYDLAGVSVWRTGFEDASFWQAVQKALTS